MTKFLKTYWLELLVFAVLALGYVICMTPGFTWINTDCDGPHYTYAAKWFYPAHVSSAPLYLIIGHFFTMLPGNDAWGLSLLSVIPSIISFIFVYLISAHYTGKRGASIIAAIVFGGSALAISQGTIVETYALVTMFCLTGYYAALKKQWWVAAGLLGAGMAVHHLAGIAAMVIFFSFKPFRHWKYVLFSSLFVLFYLYVPITNRAPYMWQTETNTLAGIIGGLKGTGSMLIGQIAIWDWPQRIIEAGLLLLVSFGFSLPVMIYAFKKMKWFKHSLFWLTILPVIYYATNLAPQTYVYMLPALAFGAVAVGIGLTRLSKSWITALVGITAIGLSIFNFNYFDIGRTLDPDMAAEQYYNELDKVPDGQILVAQQGWEWTMIFVYNQYEGRDIIPVCAANLPSSEYRKLLVHTYDIKVETDNFIGTILERQRYYTQDIYNKNDNVWTTYTTDPRVYGAAIERATPDTTYTGSTWQSIEIVPSWHFKPSNPYDIITGAVELEKWNNVLMSTYSAQTFIMFGFIGAFPCWFLWQLVVKKKKWSLTNVTREVQSVAREATGIGVGQETPANKKIG